MLELQTNAYRTILIDDDRKNETPEANRAMQTELKFGIDSNLITLFMFCQNSRTLETFRGIHMLLAIDSVAKGFH
jgi:hypothetical protein